MNNYYDDSDVTARYGYKVAEDPTVVSESKIPMIEAAIRGTYNIKVAQSEVHKVGNVCYT